MSTLLLTEQQDGYYVISRHTGVRERLAARFRSFELDVALANGASPDSTAALSLRARTLISRRARRRLSRQIRDVLSRARRPSNRLSPGLPICRRKVLHAWLELEELADRLSCGPVDVRGVAQAQLLLADGGSPIYTGPEYSDLEPALRSTVDALALDLSGSYTNDA